MSQLVWTAGLDRPSWNWQFKINIQPLLTTVLQPILEPTSQNKSNQRPHTGILRPPTHPGKSRFSKIGGLPVSGCLLGSAGSRMVGQWLVSNSDSFVAAAGFKLGCASHITAGQKDSQQLATSWWFYFHFFKWPFHLMTVYCKKNKN